MRILLPLILSIFCWTLVFLIHKKEKKKEIEDYKNKKLDVFRHLFRR